MSNPIMDEYIAITKEVSQNVLLCIPHKYVGLSPSGFVVRTEEPIPSFPFTVCPILTCDLQSESLPGKNAHDVVVTWSSSMGSLETLLYSLYQTYKDQHIEKTECSMKRYLYEKKLPPRKIIIPTLHRRENLEVVLHRFKEIDLPNEGFAPRILVIEHSPRPEFHSLCSQLGIEWMWIFLDPRIPQFPIGQFNKALCYDKAFLFSTPAEWYLFHDNDVIVPRDFWNKLDANVERSKTKFLQPYTHRSLLNLRPEYAEILRKNSSLADSPMSPDFYYPICKGAPGGSLYVHHDRYIEAGGHDPQFCWGYGPEDLFFFHKLKLLEPIAYADDPPIEMIHLWHPPAAMENPFYRCMDLLIKNHFMQQTLEDLSVYLAEKRILLNSFLEPHRQRA